MVSEYKYLEITYDLFVDGQYFLKGMFSIPLFWKRKISKSQAIADIKAMHQQFLPDRKLKFKWTEKLVKE